VFSFIFLYFQVAKQVIDLWLDVDLIKKSIVLPKLPMADFAIHRHDNTTSKSSASVSDCITALTSYLPKTKKIGLLPLLSDLQHVAIKTKNMQFKCRCLQGSILTVEVDFATSL
jgi:hypothetical protein